MANKQDESKEVTVKDFSNAKNILREFGRKQASDLIPRGIDMDRFERVAIECVRKTPKILKCTARSFLDAYLAAAKVGLEIDGLLGSGYLVPYGNEVQFLPGYKGYLQLCRRSDEIARINHGVVYEADEFDWALGDEPYVKHRPLAFSEEEIADEKIKFVYVIVKLKNQEKLINVWPVARVRKHMKRFSQSWKWAESGAKDRGGGRKDSTWHQHFAKMAVKTVMIDLLSSGEVPISLEVQEFAVKDRNIDMGIGVQSDPADKPKIVQTMDDLAAAMEDSNSDDVVDADYSDVPDDEEPQSEPQSEAKPQQRSAPEQRPKPEPTPKQRNPGPRATSRAVPANYRGEDLGDIPF